MMFVRLANSGDLDGLMALLDNVDGQLTTMPSTREAMAERLEACAHSLSGDVPHGSFLFVLEEDGEIICENDVYNWSGNHKNLKNAKSKKLQAKSRLEEKWTGDKMNDSTILSSPIASPVPSKHNAFQPPKRGLLFFLRTLFFDIQGEVVGTISAASTSGVAHAPGSDASLAGASVVYTR